MTAEGGNVPAPDPTVPWTGAVAVTAAILAALAAISSMMTTRHTNEAMIDQIEASDQWNFFQAKGLKLALAENSADPSADNQAKAARYRDEQKDIKAQAEAKQMSATNHRQRAGTIANAATCAQIAIAVAAISLLTKRRWFWYVSILAGIIATVFLGRGVFPLH